jgi:hypothetical protein
LAFGPNYRSGLELTRQPGRIAAYAKFGFGNGLAAVPALSLPKGASLRVLRHSHARPTGARNLATGRRRRTSSEHCGI